MTRAGLNTPLGPVWVEAAGGAITASGWGEADRAPEHPLLIEVLAQLAAYFEGGRKIFELPLDHGRSGLQAKLLMALLAIPFGETRSYGDLSKALGAPAQTIGQACGANPLPILIPCHRVLGANGLGGFSAPGGVEAKIWLLRHEGAAGLLL